MPTYDVKPTASAATPTASKAAINAALKAAVQAKDLDMGYFTDFITLLRVERADKLLKTKFEQFCINELGDNLDMWKDEGLKADAMLAEFDIAFGKFTPDDQPTYGSSTVPSIGQKGLGRGDTANPTPASTPSTDTSGGSAADGTPSGATPLSVTGSDSAAGTPAAGVTPSGGSTTNGGGDVDSKPTKDPTGELTGRKYLSGSSFKQMLSEGDEPLHDIRSYQKIEWELHNNGNIQLDEASKEELTEVNRKHDAKKAVVDAALKHLKSAEAKASALAKTIEQQQAAGCGAKGRAAVLQNTQKNLETEIAKLQAKLEETKADFQTETTKETEINMAIDNYEKEMLTLETTVKEARELVDGAEHQKNVGELNTLTLRQEALANKGKLSKDDIEAKKTERDRLLKVIEKHVERNRAKVVEKYTQTDPKNVTVRFMAKDLPTVRWNVGRGGEISLVTETNNSTGNRNCGTFETLCSLAGADIDLHAEAKRDGGKKRKNEQTEQTEQGGEDKPDGQDKAPGNGVAASGGKKGPGTGPGRPRTKDTGKFPEGQSTRKPQTPLSGVQKRKYNRKGGKPNTPKGGKPE